MYTPAVLFIVRSISRSRCSWWYLTIGTRAFRILLTPFTPGRNSCSTSPIDSSCRCTWVRSFGLVAFVWYTSREFRSGGSPERESRSSITSKSHPIRPNPLTEEPNGCASACGNIPWSEDSNCRTARNLSRLPRSFSLVTRCNTFT
uniref:Uncharacterized protein n=1 Tax=Anopheles atroparvus TaxID=41427 RepID=A0AAG5CYU0_ANOAO